MINAIRTPPAERRCEVIILGRDGTASTRLADWPLAANAWQSWPELISGECSYWADPRDYRDYMVRHLDDTTQVSGCEEQFVRSDG